MLDPRTLLTKDNGIPFVFMYIRVYSCIPLSLLLTVVDIGRHVTDLRRPERDGVAFAAHFLSPLCAAMPPASGELRRSPRAVARIPFAHCSPSAFLFLQCNK